MRADSERPEQETERIKERKPHRDLEGSVFGELTVLEYLGRIKGYRMWKCRCSCGKETRVREANLLNGHSRTCGHGNIVNNVHFVDGTYVEAISSNRIFSNNTSGVRGVYQNKKNGKWVAHITFQGRRRYLGIYDHLEEAAMARKEAEEELYGKFLAQYWAEQGQE